MADATPSQILSVRKPLTAERLRELLHYDPETGIFTRRKGGKRAGRFNRHRGYRYIGVDGEEYSEHRLAWLYMTGEWPANDVDHIDRDRINNRWANLREATRAENLHNSGGHRDSVSGLKGVTWDAARGRWQARIFVDGRNYHLGRYETPQEARAAYLGAARCMHGKFFAPPGTS